MDRNRVTAISVSTITDFAALETRWRDLETRSNPSFFQSWTWTGCLAAERFPDPVLVEAREDDGRTVALALFNRRGRTLYLGESGDPARDCVYVEFNGVLAETGREVELNAACLRAARKDAGQKGIPRRLVLSGMNIEAIVSIMNTNYTHHLKSLNSPFIVFEDKKKCFLDGCSANTRQQLRRSDRDYAERGPIRLERAETVERAHAFLASLEALHQASWTARGQPGAFAAPFFARFHRALIARGWPRGEIDLFHVAAGAHTIGFLYNFHHGGRSLAYQSGFDYAGAGRQGKPGMSCHHQAILFTRDRGGKGYEFLAGDDRYKRSLSNGTRTLHWIEVDEWYSPRVLVRRGRDFVLRHMRGTRAAREKTSA